MTASVVLLALLPSEMLTSSACDIGWLLDAMEAIFCADVEAICLKMGRLEVF